MKTLKETAVPILFFVVGAFWIWIVATGGGLLLLLASLAFILSGILLLAMPAIWVGRPLAGASALLGLVLTLYQAYQAATLFGSGLGAVGTTSFGIFGALAIVCAFLELETLSMGRSAEPSKKR